MADALQTLLEKLQTRFGDALRECALNYREITIEIPPERAIEIFTALRDEADFAFEQVVDVCGVDYAAHGDVEWATDESSSTGFSRGVEPRAIGRGPAAIQHVAGRLSPARAASPPFINCCRFPATSGCGCGCSHPTTNCRWCRR